MFKPTEEQSRIVTAARTGQDLVVQALAGTGKTSTLKLLAEALPDKKGTYIAFNRAVVEEAKSKFPSNVKCRTAHSLAYAAIGYQFRERMTSTERVTMRQMAAWMEASKFDYRFNKTNHSLTPEQIAQSAMQSVTNFCKSTDLEVLEKHIEIPILVSLNKKSEKIFCKEVLRLAILSWEDIQKSNGYLKFSHDHYLKMWQLSRPVIKGDFILFDEAQDADPVMLWIIEAQKGVQKIFCGDQYQAIYEWRGAQNALENISAEKTLWLTQSFRFGPKIADEANDILRFLDANVEVKGYPKIDSRIDKVLNPTAILCRTNAGVIQQVLEELQKNRKVSILGRKEELIYFAEACGDLQLGKRTSHPELAPFESWQEVKNYADEYPEEAQEILTMIDLVDRFGVRRLVNALREVVPESEADVLISTAHKAKGREWKSVKLAGDFLHPQDMDTEDLRLAYVAVTRAIEVLDLSEWILIQPLAKDSDAKKNLKSENVLARASENTEVETDTQDFRSGTRWTHEQDLQLVEKSMKGSSLNQISREMGRSETAIESRLAKWYLLAIDDSDKTDITRYDFRHDAWNESKVELLFACWEKDMEVVEIADELDVSIFRIATQIIRHDLVEIGEAFTDAIEEFYSHDK
jgi:hypothetical protein